jgi:hypothetical protein
MAPRIPAAVLKQWPRVSRIAYLTIAPRDVVVVEAPTELSRDQADQVRRLLKLMWPRNRALVLTGGMVLKIGTAASNGHPPAPCDDDAVDEMSHPATLQLLRKAGADVELADVRGWTRTGREEARTWALQELDAQQQQGTPVTWPRHVARAHRRRAPRTRTRRGRS